MGVVLTMTMVMITALAITREYERGTMENLLSMPLRPSEVLRGKDYPLHLGRICPGRDHSLCWPASYSKFRSTEISFSCSWPPSFLSRPTWHSESLFPPWRGISYKRCKWRCSSFLPSILLSGFMFPFRGMPWWAQILGEILPITHFLRIARGVMLKGIGFADIGRELWPIILFAAIMLAVAAKRYRQTLD